MHELIYREYHIEKFIQKTWLAPSAGQGWPSVPVAMDGEKGPFSEGGRLSCTYALAMTRTGRSRLEHRHGWLDAGMAECPCSHDSNRTFEIRALTKDGQVSL